MSSCALKNVWIRHCKMSNSFGAGELKFSKKIILNPCWTKIFRSFKNICIQFGRIVNQNRQSCLEKYPIWFEKAVFHLKLRFDLKTICFLKLLTSIIHKVRKRKVLETLRTMKGFVSAEEKARGVVETLRRLISLFVSLAVVSQFPRRACAFLFRACSLRSDVAQNSILVRLHLVISSISEGLHRSDVVTHRSVLCHPIHSLKFAIPASRAEAKWTRWSSWSECTSTCGESVQKRHRYCENSKLNQGAPCEGDVLETRPCPSSGIKCTGSHFSAFSLTVFWIRQ